MSNSFSIEDSRTNLGLDLSYLSFNQFEKLGELVVREQLVNDNYGRMLLPCWHYHAVEPYWRRTLTSAPAFWSRQSSVMEEGKSDAEAKAKMLI